MIDLIIVSDASLNKQLTLDCIHTSKLDVNVDLNIIVIESNLEVFYEGTKTIHYDFPFNYNACLNLGIRNSDSKYVAVANNDLIFHENWAHNVIKFFEQDSSLMSTSSLCGILHGVSNIREEILIGDSMISESSFPLLCGWFIFQRREIYDIIGEWDENFKFWYSDDDYRENLRKHNLKHGLVLSSRVDHLGSKTLSLIDQDKRIDYTDGSKGLFFNKYKK